MLLHERLHRYKYGYEKGLLGGITDAIGLTDYSGAEKAQSQATAAAAAANQEALQISRENIAFQREQYQEWNNVFGDLSQNLKEYYDTLDGSAASTQRLQALNTEIQVSEKQLTQTMAQRGLGESGAMAQGLTQLSQFGAQGRASIRAAEDEQAMQQKLGFLSLGLGQGTQYAGLVGSASAAGASSAISGGQVLSDVNSQYANTLWSGSQQTMNTAIKAGGEVAGGLAAAGMFSDRRLKDNLKLIARTSSGINIYTWTWNDKAKELGLESLPAIGVIAQELMVNHPLLVIKGEEGYYKVNYAKLGEIL